MALAGLREAALRIQRAVLDAADPRRAVARALARTPRGLRAAGVQHTTRGRLTVIAVGKAAAGMMEAALARTGRRLDKGLLVVPHGYRSEAVSDPRITILQAGHPVPDAGSVAAAAQAQQLVGAMAEADLCLVLISGGGSSLLSLPAPGLTLEDLVQTGRLLLASGADIAEVNTVRRHLSAISGGRLAERCRGTLVTLAISDVVGDEPAVIASGPTVADPTSFADAAAILERRALMEKVPQRVRQRIRDGEAGRVPDTPKRIPDRHRAVVIASGIVAARAAAAQAGRLGFAARVLDTALTGEAREVGRGLGRRALEARRIGTGLPACLIAAGETTVTVRGTGRGGRNQEIALAAALEIEGAAGVLLASFATDGREGNTEAAGGFASGETVAAGRSAGLDPVRCLDDNDSNAFLAAAGDLIVTGPTGTNVNDVSLVLIDRQT